MLLLNAVYAGSRDPRGHPCFQRVNALDKAEPESAVHILSWRAGSCPERVGLQLLDMDNSYLMRESLIYCFRVVHQAYTINQ